MLFFKLVSKNGDFKKFLKELAFRVQKPSLLTAHAHGGRLRTSSIKHSLNIIMKYINNQFLNFKTFKQSIETFAGRNEGNLKEFSIPTVTV